MQIIDGKKVSANVKESVRLETERLIAEHGVTPGLAVVIVGDDPASRVYVNNKKKACGLVGFKSEEYALPAETTQEELLALVDTLNKKPVPWLYPLVKKGFCLRLCRADKAANAAFFWLGLLASAALIAWKVNMIP